MKRVWFIRHAESEANAGLPSSFPSRIPLTQKGVKQAQTLCEQILEPAGLFIVSPDIRTQQTAGPIIEKFPGVPVEIWPIQEYNFLSPLACIDTTVGQRKPMVDEYWMRCQPDYIHGDGAESFLMFKSRVITAIKRIEASRYNFIIVFVHGHVIRAAWQYFITESAEVDEQCMKEYRILTTALHVANTAVFKADFNGYNWQIREPLMA